MATTEIIMRAGVSIELYNKLKAMWSTEPDYDESTFDSQIYCLVALVSKIERSVRKNKIK
jgi:hypothetical protein